MGSFGGFEWLIIILILVFFFGAKKIPQMARGLGQGYVEFKKASKKDREENRPEKEDRSAGTDKKGESGASEITGESGRPDEAETLETKRTTDRDTLDQK